MENREVSYVCILPWLKMQVSCVIILFIFFRKRHYIVKIYLTIQSLCFT